MRARTPCERYLLQMLSNPRRKNGCSFYRLVGADQHQRGHRKAERFRRFEIEDELEVRGQMNRQIGRLGAFQDAACIDADLMVSPGELSAIAHQAAGLDIFAPWIHRGERMARRQRDEL